MTPAEFSVIATARFDRDYHGLLKRHQDLAEHYAEAVSALKEDPYNRSRRYPIKKLEGVAAGEGQYRYRSGRFRIRYDIAGKTVFLKFCGLRREDTY
jgi:mRNA-degrading endonuclease RelE of RelBE toxin-antitoxin system